MNAFKLLSASFTLLAVTTLSAEETSINPPPFDSPMLLEEMDPTLEIVEAPIAASSEDIAAMVKEEFQILTNYRIHDASDSDLAAPEALKAAIILTAPKQEEVIHTAVAIPEEVPPLSQKLVLKKEEKVVASPIVSSQSLPSSALPTTRLGTSTTPQIDMREVFAGAPLIYSVLLAISIATLGLWGYTLLNMRTEKLMPQEVVVALQEKMSSGRFDEALAICQTDHSLLGRMMRSGLIVRHTNPAEMLQTMQSEGKRASSGFWQKLGLLNDVAIVAPMIGLLGTVVGMFYAFYDINRSVQSMNSLFDGLGISVGTTVAGLLLAIVALVLHSTSKYRLSKQLAHVESTANNLVSKTFRSVGKQEEHL